MKKIVLFGLVVLCVSAMVLAAPSGGTFIPTVQATTGTINTYTAMLATAPPAQQGGLVMMLNNELVKVNSALDEQNGVSTLGLTTEERAVYAQAVTDLNLALRNCREVALAKNKGLLALSTKITVNFLITVVMDEANEDAALYNELNGRAPAGGTVWGTVS